MHQRRKDITVSKLLTLPQALRLYADSMVDLAVNFGEDAALEGAEDLIADIAHDTDPSVRDEFAFLAKGR
jgi:hypothetical protein